MRPGGGGAGGGGGGGGRAAPPPPPPPPPPATEARRAGAHPPPKDAPIPYACSRGLTAPPPRGAAGRSCSKAKEGHRRGVFVAVSGKFTNYIIESVKKWGRHTCCAPTRYLVQQSSRVYRGSILVVQQVQQGPGRASSKLGSPSSGPSPNLTSTTCALLGPLRHTCAWRRQMP
jgi:hypothetical protein